MREMTGLVTEIDEWRPRICVIGVGGAGGNAVANMMAGDLRGIEFIAINTDGQALRHSPAHRVVQLGRVLTYGLGAGSQAEIGKAAAEESLAEIEELLEGAHMCFIAAGMGGGTGSGAAPVIAKASHDKGILTVGVVTKPFAFEGARRARIAERALEELRREVDTLIVIPNQNLFRIATAEMTFKAAFALADDVLQQGVRGITDLMTIPGFINLDFADIRSIMTDAGTAMLGVGEAGGEHRAIRAAEQAIANPLFDGVIKGTTGLIISITASDDISLWEIEEIAGLVGGMAHPEAKIIWGSVFDPSLAGRIRVTFVATGLDVPVATSATAVETDSWRDPPQMSVSMASAGSPAPTRQEPSEVRTGLPGLFLPDTFLRDDAAEWTVHRSLLVHPTGATPFRTIDASIAERKGAPASSLFNKVARPGPSLFERMAMLAGGLPNKANNSCAASEPRGEPGHEITATPRERALETCAAVWPIARSDER